MSLYETKAAGIRNQLQPNGAAPSSLERAIYRGEQNIDSPGYAKFLVGRYNIERNEILGKLIVDSRSFDSVEEALKYCDGLYKNEHAVLEKELENREAKEKGRLREQDIRQQAVIKRGNQAIVILVVFLFVALIASVLLPQFMQGFFPR